MLNSMKSGAPEKDKSAAANAPEVMGRMVQPHDQAWARSEPTTKAGMALPPRSPRQERDSQRASNPR
jgi:hypothetical protein